MKLLGLDYSNLLIRHAANPYGESTDRQGRPVGGVVGSLAQAIRIVKAEKPTHLLVAQDGSRKDSFRREIDEGYKAHRPEAPDDLRHQFLIAYRALEALGWPVVSVDGYEADDILASAASAFAGQSVIVTGDKDLLAVAASDVRISLLRPGGARECGPDDAEDIFGVPPSRIQDYKALVGDASDGIRGIEGIGPKRALALLGEYGSLEGILDAATSSESLSGPGISPAVSRKVFDGREAAETSYKLAGLVLDLEIVFDDLVCPDMPAPDTHKAALQALGLDALLEQLNKKPKSKATQSRSIDLAGTFNNAVKSSDS